MNLGIIIERNLKDAMNLERITWTDSFSSDKWTHIADIDDEELIITTVGFVVKETKEIITLASTVHSGAMACCLMAIPKCCIKSRSKIPTKRKPL